MTCNNMKKEAVQGLSGLMLVKTCEKIKMDPQEKNPEWGKRKHFAHDKNRGDTFAAKECLCAFSF